MISVLEARGVTPQVSRWTTRQAKILARPLEYTRRRLPRTDHSIGGLELPDDLQFAEFSSTDVPGSEAIVEYCRKIFHKKKIQLDNNTKQTDYNIELLRYENTQTSHILGDVDELRPIFEFAIQPIFIQAATKYCKEIPVVGNINILYTPPYREMDGSQYWHCDRGFKREFVLFLLIDPVDEESGPFTYLDVEKTNIVIDKLSYTGGRVSDKDIESSVGANSIRTFTGPPGTMLLCSPNYLFHHGARTKSKHRIVLEIRYTSLFTPVDQHNSVYRAQNRSELLNGDPLRRRLLDA